MKTYELILLAVALAMDAFAVAVCKGLSMRKINHKYALIIGLFFGFFQALMPTTNFDHWIAFILLAFIGGKMIYECLTEDDNECTACESILDIRELTVLSVATSIDALAAGITFACLDVSIKSSASLIGVITFVLSYIGVAVGNKFGSKYKKKAEFAGGVVLILIGIKILLEHLGVIA